jgi:hypothetical protein
LYFNFLAIESQNNPQWLIRQASCGAATTGRRSGFQAGVRSGKNRRAETIKTWFVSIQVRFAKTQLLREYYH